jgi:sec-independent protein translocase protein TatA
MGTFGPLHWLLVIAVIILLFGGRGKISELMGDVAKGVKSFRQGLSEHDEKPKLPGDEPPKDSQAGH